MDRKTSQDADLAIVEFAAFIMGKNTTDRDALVESFSDTTEELGCFSF